MVYSKAKTVRAYVESLPAERRVIVSAVRKVVNARLPKGYRETIGYGMINWVVPLSRYPVTYNGQPLCYAALAAQKNNYSLYLMCAYGHAPLAAKMLAGFRAAGKRLDMGKSCVRFKKLEDLPMHVIGDVIAAVPVETFLARYEKVKGK